MLATEVRRGSSIKNYDAIFIDLYTMHYILYFHLPSDLLICNFIYL
jgi:hypothetical protein